MQEAKLSYGVVAGVLGGLVGSLFLKGFILGGRSLREGKTVTQLDQRGPSHEVANLAAKQFTGSDLSPASRALGGELMHYAFGAAVGGFYGGLAEYAPWVTAGAGALFGTGVFVAADESSLPALGLANKPWDETLDVQAEHYLAHLVFGVVTEFSRRSIRARM